MDHDVELRAIPKQLLVPHRTEHDLIGCVAVGRAVFPSLKTHKNMKFLQWLYVTQKEGKNIKTDAMTQTVLEHSCSRSRHATERHLPSSGKTVLAPSTLWALRQHTLLCLRTKLRTRLFFAPIEKLRCTASSFSQQSNAQLPITSFLYWQHGVNSVQLVIKNN